MLRLVLISFISIFFISTSDAQSIYIQGGINFANITVDNNGKTQENNSLTSFNAGISARFNIFRQLQLESGLLFTGHGAKAETRFETTGPDQITKVTADFNPFYIQLPLNAVLNLQSSKAGMSFFVHAGPYIATGITGNSTVTTYGSIAGTVKNKREIKYFNDDLTFETEEAGYSYLRRIDYGLNFGGGINFEKLIIKVNYGAGLSNINASKELFTAKDENKLRTFSLSVGIPVGK